jgi:hypothetical protein
MDADADGMSSSAAASASLLRLRTISARDTPMDRSTPMLEPDIMSGLLLLEFA